MHLFLEIQERSNSNLEKKFNEFGQLIFEEYSDYGYGGYSKSFIYDELGKLEKEVEKKWTLHGNGSEEKYLKKYEYDGDDYRIFTYLTHFLDDSQGIYEQLFEDKKFIKIDDLLTVQNYRYQNKLLIYENHVSILNKTSYHLNYNYQSEKIISEERYDDNKLSYKIDFFYLDDKLVKKKKTINSYHEEVEYSYQADKLIGIKTFDCFSNNKILKREGIFNSDDDLKMETTEHYEMINNRRYIVLKEKNYKSEHRIMKEFRDISGYLLNYELDESTLTSISESSFGIAEGSSAIEELFDNENHLKEMTFLNPENHMQILSKYFYHNEYNINGDLEITIVFNLDINNLKLHTDSTTKFYYK